MNDKLNDLFLEVRAECLQMINNKSINIEDLSFRMGISVNNLNKILNEKSEDFSIYLKLYEVLLGW